MKKFILMTVVSLFVSSGFLAGPLGPGLAGAQEKCVQDGTPFKKVTKECFGADVEVVILFKKGGRIELLEGAEVTFKKPKSQGGDTVTEQPPAGKDKDRDQLPLVLADDIKTKKFKQTEINIYGSQTCGWFNGQWICW